MAHKTQNVMLVRPNLFPSISRLHLSYAEWNIYGIVIRRTAGRDCTLWLHAEQAACIMSFVCEFWKVIWRQLRLFGEHKYYMAGSRCSLDLRAANPTVPRSKRHSLDFNCFSTVSFDYCQSYTTLNVAHKKSTACFVSTNQEVRFSCHLTDTLNCCPPVRDFNSKSSHGKIMYLSLHISSQHIIAVWERELVSWSAVVRFIFHCGAVRGRHSERLREQQTWWSCFLTFSLHKGRRRKLLLPNVLSPNLLNITVLCSGLGAKNMS